MPQMRIDLRRLQRLWTTPLGTRPRKKIRAYFLYRNQHIDRVSYFPMINKQTSRIDFDAARLLVSLYLRPINLQKNSGRNFLWVSPSHSQWKMVHSDGYKEERIFRNYSPEVQCHSEQNVVEWRISCKAHVILNGTMWSEESQPIKEPGGIPHMRSEGQWSYGEASQPMRIKRWDSSSGYRPRSKWQTYRCPQKPSVILNET